MPQPVPTLTILNAPTALQYTDFAFLNATATYSTSSIRTFFSVVSSNGLGAYVPYSGNGYIIYNTALSALSSTGTVTVLVSSLSSNLYDSASATFNTALQKLDLSNKIVLAGLNRIYTGDTIAASATVTGHSSITPSIVYYADNLTVTTPQASGYYTVSATIVDQDLYVGTSVNILSVINIDDFYNLPVSAASSAIYFPKIVDTEKDIVVSFDYAFYSSYDNGYEGFLVSFTDATGDAETFYDPRWTNNTPIYGGGPGKGLGYTNLTVLTQPNSSSNTFTSTVYTGKYRGSLGIGFDASGNFALSSLDVTGYSAPSPNTICLRDSYLNNYNVIHRTSNLLTENPDYPVALYHQGATPEYRSVRIRITNLGKRVIVDMKPLSGETYYNFLAYDLPAPLPKALSVALAYSTGKISPAFNIKNFNLNCFFSSVTAGRYIDPDAQAYANRSGASDLYAINDFVLSAKKLEVWDQLICWPMRSTMNAGSGTTVYSIGGLTAYNGTMDSYYNHLVSEEFPGGMERAYTFVNFDFSVLSSYPGTGTNVYNITENRYDLYRGTIATISNMPANNNVAQYLPKYGGGMKFRPYGGGSADNAMLYYGYDWNLNFGLNNNFSISMWLELSSFGGFNQFMVIGNYEGDGFRILEYDNKIHFSTGQQSPPGAYSSVPRIDVDTGVIPLNTPVNIVFTVEPVSFPVCRATCYLDGKQVATQAGLFLKPGLSGASSGYNTQFRFFGQSGVPAMDCTLYNTEFMSVVMPAKDVAIRYNQRAAQFNKTPIAIDQPQWTREGILFPSGGTYIKYPTLYNPPLSTGQFGYATFGVVCLSGVGNWMNQNNNEGVSLDLFSDIAVDNPGFGFGLGAPGGAQWHDTSLGPVYQGANWNDPLLGPTYVDNYMRYFPMNLYQPTYYKTNFFYTAWRPSTEPYGPNSADSNTLYINNTVLPNGYLPMDEYGAGLATKKNVYTGMPNPGRTNKNNTVSIVGYLSGAVTDSEMRQLYYIVKNTLCKDQIVEL
jgi:hypothetical protein